VVRPANPIFSSLQQVAIFDNFTPSDKGRPGRETGKNDGCPGKAYDRPVALRAAKASACRNHLEVIKGVQVGSETTVQDFLTESGDFRTQVEGLAKEGTVVRKEYFPPGTGGGCPGTSGSTGGFA